LKKVLASIVAGKENYEVTSGEILDGRPFRISSEEEKRHGVSSLFSTQ
jgi:Fe-S cluster assembly ATPase SufC